METIISPDSTQALTEFVNIAKQDPKAELECKLLLGKIQTKDVADNIINAIQTLSLGEVTEEVRLSISYADSTRVLITGNKNIQKILSTNSFKEVPLLVEKKKRYSDSKSVIDIPDANIRFSLSSETEIKKDWQGDPSDPKGHVRLINRKSFKTSDDLFRIDFSMVKSRGANSKQQIKDLLNNNHIYELEIEFIKKAEVMNSAVVKEYIHILSVLSKAYYQTDFLLKESDIQRYKEEFSKTKNVFYDVVTLTKRHLVLKNPNNISKGYTVTNKADGERCALFVTKDRRLIRITKNLKIVWTGLVAKDDKHHEDFIDGEFIPDKNLFCIFDAYRFEKRDTKPLPLFVTDEDVITNPLNSRLGCARLFVEKIKSDFVTPPGETMRIETKLFLAGDGQSMEDSIKTILSMNFEYETDGLIFTPRATSVAPSEYRKGRTWLTAYKWKPANQNSIDFFLKINNDTFDPLTQSDGKLGGLYVSRTIGDDIIYPRETMNGEYISPKLPTDLQKLTHTNTRVPSPFQPSSPYNPDAYKIFIPINEKKMPIDKQGNRVEDSTIVECSFDTDTNRWIIMRTRYDKTYQFRVLKEPQFGNDISVANSIWASINDPVTELMIEGFISKPIEDTFEDDMYYRDDLRRTIRIFNDVYAFHNQIKDNLYSQNIEAKDTLLELAVGRGGDLHKWKKSKVSKVVGLDISLSNITSISQGSAVRYLNDKKNNPHDYLPPILFVQGDMTLPLFEQDDKYTPILTGKEKATTDYLSQFENLYKFDKVSCQFAIHYACGSEETFTNFAKNIQTHCNDVFFGTCLDGQALYSLLLGKKNHIFGTVTQIAGEYTKEYEDSTWADEFGLGINVHMESFVVPTLEYLVPFKKVTEIMKDHGFELIESKLFSEIYDEQSRTTLNPKQQEFSFLNRTFVFKRFEKEKEKEKDKEKEKEPEKEKGGKKRKLQKEPEKETVLFFGEDESQGLFKNFSPDSSHPVIIEGEDYNTLTHYMECMKAQMFEDTETLEKLKKTPTTKAAKALGKKVKGFDDTKWNEKCIDILRKGLRAKFVKQDLQKQLLETDDKVIGYADPRDVILGIGCAMGTPKSTAPSKWRGKNELGKLLMELRDTLKKEAQGENSVD